MPLEGAPTPTSLLWAPGRLRGLCGGSARTMPKHCPRHSVVRLRPGPGEATRWTGWNGEAVRVPKSGQGGAIERTYTGRQAFLREDSLLLQTLQSEAPYPAALKGPNSPWPPASCSRTGGGRGAPNLGHLGPRALLPQPRAL